MAYTKQNFVDQQVLTAGHLNHIESGIAALDSGIAELESGIAELSNEIDSSIAALDSEKTEMKLLWQNATVYSSFSAQKINLDLSGYKRVRIDCYPVQASVAGEQFGYFTTEGLVGTKVMCVTFGSANENGYGINWVSTRRADVSTSGVNFWNGGYTRMTNGEIGLHDDYCIPMRIYGIKGVT